MDYQPRSRLTRTYHARPRSKGPTGPRAPSNDPAKHLRNLTSRSSRPFRGSAKTPHGWSFWAPWPAGAGREGDERGVGRRQDDVEVVIAHETGHAVLPREAVEACCRGVVARAGDGVVEALEEFGLGCIGFEVGGILVSD